MNSFLDKLNIKWKEGKFVCVGLDSDYTKIPDSFKKGKSIDSAISQFNQAIVDATHDLVAAYKPNSAFYEAEGVAGWKALKQTVEYIRETYPDIFLLLDAKRADIGNTNEGYVKAIFDELKFDGVTVHPYLGQEAIQPFLERKDKGVFILVKTSNPGASEFQDLKVSPQQKPLYQVIAEKVAKNWNKNNNVGAVVGATYPEELKEVRKIIGDMPILIPGVGAQGGDVKATILAGKDSRGWGMVISSSRGIIFAKDPRQATLKLTNQIKSVITELSS